MKSTVLFLLLASVGACAPHPQTTEAVAGPSAPPTSPINCFIGAAVMAEARLQPVPEAQCVTDAKPGNAGGGIRDCKTFKVPDGGMRVYRAFRNRDQASCSKPEAQLGHWWSFGSPNDVGINEYRKLAVLCPDWNYQCVEVCVIAAGAIVNVGDGSALDCAKAGSKEPVMVPDSPLPQMYVTSPSKDIDPASCQVVPTRP